MPQCYPFQIVVLIFISSYALLIASDQKEALPSWAQMSMEDILGEEVSSISNYAEKRFQAASSITLISSKEIEHYGAWNYADIFRYVPGMQVAQVNAHENAISVRGNNSTFANDLLVIMDGRTLYNSIFSGVFWDAQHYIMEDLNHIEVIRGPGSTVWGSNAVNGVVSIQSKSAENTLGSLINVEYGSDFRSSAYRYGGQSGDHLYYRIYWLGKEHFGSRGYAVGDVTENLEQDYNDDWKHGQSGFRMDYNLGSEKSLTVQGDVYKIYYDTQFRKSYRRSAPPFRSLELIEESTLGYNILGHYKSGDEYDGYGIKSYYDYWDRDYSLTDGSNAQFDIEYNQYATLQNNHKLSWGLGFRHYKVFVEDTETITSLKNKQSSQVGSAYLQNTIPLLNDDIELTIGSKIEYLNDPDLRDFFEIQPSARLSYNMDQGCMIWMGVSRSIKTPNYVNRYITRYDNRNDFSADLPFPIQIITKQNENFEPVEIFTFELGNRQLIDDHWSIESSLFYRITENDLTYTITDQTNTVTTLTPVNLREKEAFGGDFMAGYQVNEDLKFRLGYSYYNVRSRLSNGTLDVYPLSTGDEDPEHQWSFKSDYEASDRWSFFAGLRYVSGLNLSIPPNASITSERYQIPAYLDMDAGIHWTPAKDWKVSLMGRNLLDRQRSEFANLEYASGKSESTRNFSVKVVCEF